MRSVSNKGYAELGLRDATTELDDAEWIQKVNQAFFDSLNKDVEQIRSQKIGRNNFDILSLDWSSGKVLQSLTEFYQDSLVEDAKFAVVQFLAVSDELRHPLLRLCFYVTVIGSVLVHGKYEGHKFVGGLFQAYAREIADLPCFEKSADESDDVFEHMSPSMFANIALVSYTLRFAASICDYVGTNPLEESMMPILSCSPLVRLPSRLWTIALESVDLHPLYNWLVRCRGRNQYLWRLERASLHAIKLKKKSIPLDYFESLAQGRVVLTVLAVRYGCDKFPDPCLSEALAPKERLRLILRVVAFLPREQDPPSYGIVVETICNELHLATGISSFFNDVLAFSEHDISESMNMGILSRPPLLGAQDPADDEPIELTVCRHLTTSVSCFMTARYGNASLKAVNVLINQFNTGSRWWLLRQCVRAIGNADLVSLLIDFIRREVIVESAFAKRFPEELSKYVYFKFEDATYPSADHQLIPKYLGTVGCFCSELVLILVHDIVSRRCNSCFGNILLSEQSKVHQSVCSLAKVLLLVGTHGHLSRLNDACRRYFSSSQWKTTYLAFLHTKIAGEMRSLQNDLGFIDRPPREHDVSCVTYSEGKPTPEIMPSHTASSRSEGQSSLSNLMLLDQALNDVKEQMEDCGISLQESSQNRL